MTPSHYGPLFRVVADGGILPGTYGGNSFTLRGGSDEFANDALGDIDFSVDVRDNGPAPVPDPGTLALLGLGLAGLALRRRAKAS